jgi:hypothetical protein
VIAQPDVDRVEAELNGQFVECRLEGKQARRLPDPAHEVRHHRVRCRDAIPGVEVVAGVEQRARGARPFGEVIDHRRRSELVMANRGQLPVASRAQCELLLLLFAVAGCGRHLVAGDHELHWPRELAGNEHCEGGVEPEGPFRAERAADKAADDANVFRVEVEQVAEVELDHRDPLGCLIDRHL